MCNIGISAENFNPRILYLGKGYQNYNSEQVYHSHEFTEIKCILSGCCIYNIDGNLYPVEKGDIIICNPGAKHRKLLNPGEEVSEFYSAINNITVDNYPANYLIATDASPVLSFPKYRQDFFDCCSELLNEQAKNSPGCDLMLKALMMKLLTNILIATYSQEYPENQRHLDFESYDKTYIVNTIINYVSENYMKDISLDKISRNMYLSPVYISKIFKDETGDSPINFLIKLRLSKAIELLKEDKLTIKALAKSVGYKDPYYFSKLFKKYYLSSPQSYKNKLKTGLSEADTVTEI